MGFRKGRKGDRRFAIFEWRFTIGFPKPAADGFPDIEVRFAKGGRGGIDVDIGMEGLAAGGDLARRPALRSAQDLRGLKRLFEQELRAMFV